MPILAEIAFVFSYEPSQHHVFSPKYITTCVHSISNNCHAKMISFSYFQLRRSAKVSFPDLEIPLLLPLFLQNK